MTDGSFGFSRFLAQWDLLVQQSLPQGRTVQSPHRNGHPSVFTPTKRNKLWQFHYLWHAPNLAYTLQYSHLYLQLSTTVQGGTYKTLMRNPKKTNKPKLNKVIGSSDKRFWLVKNAVLCRTGEGEFAHTLTLQLALWLHIYNVLFTQQDPSIGMMSSSIYLSLIRKEQ